MFIGCRLTAVFAEPDHSSAKSFPLASVPCPTWCVPSVEDAIELTNPLRLVRCRSTAVLAAPDQRNAWRDEPSAASPTCWPPLFLLQCCQLPRTPAASRGGH